MRRAKRLKLRQKDNLVQLMFCFDTSEKTQESCGKETAQYEQKGENLSEDVEKKEKKKQSPALCLAERKIIESNIKKNLSATDIAKILGRSKNCIVWEIRRAGGKSVYNAEKAQKDAEKRMMNKYAGFRMRSAQNAEIKEKTLYIRVENLEMQIEILSNTLKELYHERSKKNN